MLAARIQAPKTSLDLQQQVLEGDSALLLPGLEDCKSQETWTEHVQGAAAAAAGSTAGSDACKAEAVAQAVKDGDDISASIDSKGEDAKANRATACSSATAKDTQQRLRCVGQGSWMSDCAVAQEEQLLALATEQGDAMRW
jgi:hypothetical protein